MEHIQCLCFEISHVDLDPLGCLMALYSWFMLLWAFCLQRGREDALVFTPAMELTA